jgi:hypothetical protein
MSDRSSSRPPVCPASWRSPSATSSQLIGMVAMPMQHARPNGHVPYSFPTVREIRRRQEEGLLPAPRAAGVDAGASSPPAYVAAPAPRLRAVFWRPADVALRSAAAGLRLGAQVLWPVLQSFSWSEGRAVDAAQTKGEAKDQTPTSQEPPASAASGKSCIPDEDLHQTAGTWRRHEGPANSVQALIESYADDQTCSVVASSTLAARQQQVLKDVVVFVEAEGLSPESSAKVLKAWRPGDLVVWETDAARHVLHGASREVRQRAGEQWQERVLSLPARYRQVVEVLMTAERKLMAALSAATGEPMLELPSSGKEQTQYDLQLVRRLQKVDPDTVNPAMLAKVLKAKQQKMEAGTHYQELVGSIDEQRFVELKGMLAARSTDRNVFVICSRRLAKRAWPEQSRNGRAILFSSADARLDLTDEEFSPLARMQYEYGDRLTFEFSFDADDFEGKALEGLLIVLSGFDESGVGEKLVSANFLRTFAHGGRDTILRQVTASGEDCKQGFGMNGGACNFIEPPEWRGRIDEKRQALRRTLSAFAAELRHVDPHAIESANAWEALTPWQMRDRILELAPDDTSVQSLLSPAGVAVALKARRDMDEWSDLERDSAPARETYVMQRISESVGKRHATFVLLETFFVDRLRGELLNAKNYKTVIVRNKPPKSPSA